MYPNNYDPNAVIAQALAMQPSTSGGSTLPSIMSASAGNQYYGPTHQALSDALAAALAKQFTNAGLLDPVTAQGMGLLSTAPQSVPSNFYSLSSNSYNSSSPFTGGGSLGTSGTSSTTSSAGIPANSAQLSNGGGPSGNYAGTNNNPTNPNGQYDPLGIFHGGLFGTPTADDAPGADTKTAANLSAATTTNDAVANPGYSASIGPITGTNLAAPTLSNDLTGYRMSYSPITGTDLSAPAATASNPFFGQPSSGTTTFGDGSNLASGYPDVAVSSKDQSQLQAEQPNIPGTFNGPFTYSGFTPVASDNTLGGVSNAAMPGYGSFSFTNADGSGSFNGIPTSSADNSAMGNSDNGDEGGGGGEGGDHAHGGLITQNDLRGAKPNNGDDGWATMKDGEYVIRPESVKVLPAGLLASLNEIYKAKNPRKALKGLLEKV